MSQSWCLNVKIGKWIVSQEPFFVSCIKGIYSLMSKKEMCVALFLVFLWHDGASRNINYVLKSLVRFDISKVITVPSGRIMNVFTMESCSVIDRRHWNKKVSLLVVLEEKFGESLIVKFYSGPKCWTNHTIGSVILKVPWEHSYVPRILWFSGHMLLGSHVS